MSSDLHEGTATPMDAPEPPRRPGELTPRELARWIWRQLTSMRTALILLLLLALAAVPGSLIPQQGVDSLKTSQWKDAHPTLAPIYDRLGLFDVFGSVWFSAIYLLLMISLLGCIVPRTFVYARNIRAVPPAAPRNLTRLPDHTTYVVDEDPQEVLARARAVLAGRHYRIRPADDGGAETAVSAERGYLREVGNLIFHVSVLIVLVGFGVGSLFGFKGGVIVPVGADQGFSNTVSQYDDFDPGSLFSVGGMQPFHFSIDGFDINWLTSGPRQGMANEFDSHLTYTAEPGAPEQQADLRVNHPLTIGNTELFLIGHGYAPVITVRDGSGRIVVSGPTVFLPLDSSFFSFGVVKAQGLDQPDVGLQGYFYPFFIKGPDGTPSNIMGDDKNPLVSLNVWEGDLGLDSGATSSVYSLDTSRMTQLKNDDDQPLRLDLRPGESATLPDGLGSVTLDGVVAWNKIQLSHTPGKRIALGGVVLALLGLLGSLFIRPRRVWVRARRTPEGTLVEVAALDRSGGGDIPALIDDLVVALHGPTTDRSTPPDEEKAQA